MKRLVAGIMLVVLVCTGASAESLVWKARKGDSTIYLGGTLHLLRESDFPLPPEYDKAYRASDVVVFETDMGALADAETQRKLLAEATYADGTTIDRHLSAKAYDELREYCTANGIPLQAFKQLKPSMLIATLTMMELMKLGIGQYGVDRFFYERAKKDKKSMEGLETIDEQMTYIVSMADGDENDFVTYSLKDLKTIKQSFEDFESAWRKGDAGKLDQLINADLKAGQPKLYRKLITDRNRNWLSLIDADRKSRQTKFILVGAGHLVGVDGIIEALRKKGYKVEKL